MRRLSRREFKKMILGFMQFVSSKKRREFSSFGNGKRYTDKQRSYAFGILGKSGVRATAKILMIPRRTLQRWCRKNDVYVRRCPDWVYGWAERRRKRQAFWARRGYR
jgi:hypothetical protein